MKERMTQVLLVVIAVLLMAQFFRGGWVAPIVQRTESGSEVIRALLSQGVGTTVTLSEKGKEKLVIRP